MEERLTEGPRNGQHHLFAIELDNQKELLGTICYKILWYMFLLPRDGRKVCAIIPAAPAPAAPAPAPPIPARTNMDLYHQAKTITRWRCSEGGEEGGQLVQGLWLKVYVLHIINSYVYITQAKC